MQNKITAGIQGERFPTAHQRSRPTKDITVQSNNDFLALLQDIQLFNDALDPAANTIVTLLEAYQHAVNINGTKAEFAIAALRNCIEAETHLLQMEPIMDHPTMSLSMQKDCLVIKLEQGADKREVTLYKDGKVKALHCEHEQVRIGFKQVIEDGDIKRTEELYIKGTIVPTAERKPKSFGIQFEGHFMRSLCGITIGRISQSGLGATGYGKAFLEDGTIEEGYFYNGGLLYGKKVFTGKYACSEVEGYFGTESPWSRYTIFQFKRTLTHYTEVTTGTGTSRHCQLRYHADGAQFEETKYPEGKLDATVVDEGAFGLERLDIPLEAPGGRGGSTMIGLGLMKEDVQDAIERNSELPPLERDLLGICHATLEERLYDIATLTKKGIHELFQTQQHSPCLIAMKTREHAMMALVYKNTFIFVNTGEGVLINENGFIQPGTPFSFTSEHTLQTALEFFQTGEESPSVLGSRFDIHTQNPPGLTREEDYPKHLWTYPQFGEACHYMAPKEAIKLIAWIIVKERIEAGDECISRYRALVEKVTGRECREKALITYFIHRAENEKGYKIQLDGPLKKLTKQHGVAPQVRARNAKAIEIIRDIHRNKKALSYVEARVKELQRLSETPGKTGELAKQKLANLQSSPFYAELYQ